MLKSILHIIQNCPVQKTPRKKTLFIGEMRPFYKTASVEGLQPLQNSHFGSKIKIPKNMLKANLLVILNCFVDKTAKKNKQTNNNNNTKYSKNKTILKIGHHGKAIAFAKWSP